MREPDPNLPLPSTAPELDPVSKLARELRQRIRDEEPIGETAGPPNATPPEAAPIPTPTPATAPAAQDNLDELLSLAKPFASASTMKGESIQWVAERSALGVLRLCLRALSVPGGGLSFGASDIHASDPELSRIYETPKVIGDILGDLGQRGKHGRVHEPGMDLPALKPGKGGRQFSPSIEAASRAIGKLRSHFFTDEMIAAELGLPDVATLKAKLLGLWHHDRYAVAYPRGRRSISGR